MNPHYHHSPYPEMNSPHSPHSDGVPSGYHNLGGGGGGGGGGHGQQMPPTPNGHMMGPHHDHLHSHPAFNGGGGGGGGGGPAGHMTGPNQMYHHHPHLHLHHHNMMNNNNNNNNNNNHNNNSNIQIKSEQYNNQIKSEQYNNQIKSESYNNQIKSEPKSESYNDDDQNCGIKICGGCHHRIMERYVFRVVDKNWHHSCLKCHFCGRPLADIGTTCFYKNGMLLCKQDYTRMFGGLCSACNQMIPANEFVMRTGGPPSSGPGGVTGGSVPPGGPQVFHLKCFVCCKCGTKLQPGDRYYLLSNSLVCEQDWPKLIKPGTGGAGAQQTTGTVRKGKVGRPRRTRE